MKTIHKIITAVLVVWVAVQTGYYLYIAYLLNKIYALSPPDPVNQLMMSQMRGTFPIEWWVVLVGWLWWLESKKKKEEEL